MRIFIGIKPEQTATDKMEKFLKPFKKMATPIRWVRSENIHITLKFIGEVTTDTYQKIENTLCTTEFPSEPFQLELRGCGKFGRGTDINIFWLGMTPTPSLTQLYQTIEENLGKIGIQKEERPFKPHLTVGRNKKRFNFKSFLPLIDEWKEEKITDLEVYSFQVFKSQLTPEGPIYTKLKEIPLAKA